MKIKIELNPVNAMELLLLLKEILPDHLREEYQLAQIFEAKDEFSNEVINKITPEQFQEVLRTEQVNLLIGKIPKT